MTSPSFLSAKKGFTLIELLIALAMISILAMIAVPAFNEWIPDQRLKAAARDLVSDLNNAKSIAVEENTTSTVVFDNSLIPDGINFGTGSATRDWNNDPISSSITFTDSKITFDARGLADKSGAVFLENKNNDICLAVTVTGVGSIKIREYNGSW